MFKWVKKAKRLITGKGNQRSLVRIEDDGFLSEDISVSIEDFANQEETEDLGKLHILSLTEFHKVLGDTWDAREDKIFMLTEGVLRDRIGPGNRWEHRSKEIYVMLFPKLSEVEAQARSFEIAEEIGFKIIGERFDGSRRPLVRVADVDLADAFNEDGTLDIELLEAAGRDGITAGKGVHDEDGKKIDPGQDDEDAEKLAWQKKKWEHEEAKTDWEKQQLENAEVNTNWEQQNLDNLCGADPDWQKQQVEGCEARPRDPNWQAIAQENQAAKPNVDITLQKPQYLFNYQPCWDKKKQSLHIYRATLCYVAADQRKIEGLSAYSGYSSTQDRLKIDLRVLQETAKSLFPMISKRVQTPVFVPVHSSSLRGENLAVFLETLTRFTDNLRKGYLILEIIDDGKWNNKSLQAVLIKLKKQILALAFLGHHKQELTLKGIDWIGVDLKQSRPDQAISEETITRLRTQANQQGQKLYTFGLKSREQLAHMIDLGSDLICGKALAKVTDKLRPPFNLPIERIKK
ncbi:hypothetical protein [Terasakiella sp. SH-1]|uniref:hypothetical protein n=1 Tax=Terasakiella sp. SH-1 TaxID=2560057 RepID=UPI0010740581|nr:hypothetical protein [Terasakiella sp. SH-1]